MSRYHRGGRNFRKFYHRKEERLAQFGEQFDKDSESDSRGYTGETSLKRKELGEDYYQKTEDERQGNTGRGRGKGRPPPHLRGREIGMWFRSKYIAQGSRVGSRREENSVKKFQLKLNYEKQRQIKSLLSSTEGQVKIQEHLEKSASSSSLSDKYDYMEDSTFKKKFLQIVTGSIEENLEHALLMRPVLNQNEDIDKALKEELLQKQSSRRYQQMLKFRKSLPAFKMQDKILELLEHNQVILISGETGCGKTTQVAQFVLDDLIMKNKGSSCHIVCTQPRRISATSVATRVAEERDERVGQASVGYLIRVDKQLPRLKGSILFCTTGIMLQRMHSDPALSDVSHVILDEIHERDTTSDFIITILKNNVIPKRKDLKVILMSATLNAERFSEYYDNCPSINIPGITYPVKEYYLEDILEITNFELPLPKHQPTWKKYTQHGKQKMREENEFKQFIEPYINNLQGCNKYSKRVLSMLSNPESEQINLELIAALVKCIHLRKDEGAILIFLPGWDKISRMHKLLTDHIQFPSSQFLVIPLHSMMPTVRQLTVFQKPAHGIRKVIISTSIAETSITIDDVVYIIDCGKTKMQNFDVERNIETLTEEWISVANAKQRRGRAGRVQPGECYHLFAKARLFTLPDYPVPEMLRTRLADIVLQIKILQLGKVSTFLERVMDPPNPITVNLSIHLLKTLNALDADENLTPLGFHLARLPMDPQTGKMILMSAIFSCVDPILTLAATLSFKDAFYVPLNLEKEATRKKLQLSRGYNSDHIVAIEAFQQWERAVKAGRGYPFCREYFLSYNTLSMLKDVKEQFADHLYNIGYINSKDPKSYDSNLNSENISLIKAIICAGLYPNVAIVRAVKRRGRSTEATVLLYTPEDGKVKLHPRSINETQTVFQSPFLLYHMKLKSSGVYLHDTTMVHPLPLLFFGQECNLKMQDGGVIIAVDQSLQFQSEETAAELIKELRSRMDQLLAYKISHPGTINWNGREGALLRAIIELITSEDEQGMLKIEAEEQSSSCSPPREHHWQ